MATVADLVFEKKGIHLHYVLIDVMLWDYDFHSSNYETATNKESQNIVIIAYKFFENIKKVSAVSLKIHFLILIQ